VNQFELLFRSVAFSALTLGAETFALVRTTEQLIPNLEKEPTVSWFPNNSFGMMAIVLKGRIEDWVVRIGPVHFISPVQIYAIKVKESSKFKEHEVHVNGHEQGKEQ